MVKKILKKVLLILGILLGVILLAFIGLVIFLTVTEYKPAPSQSAEYVQTQDDAPKASTELTVYSWNIGYGGLGAESDFFMDGGKMVNPPSQEVMENNLAEIHEFICATPADAWLLQEIDLNCSRTYYTNELENLADVYGGSYAFAYNYNCPFVPIPLPPLGKMESGIATLTRLAMDEDAQRIALPCPFSWPVRCANLKRCLLVTRLPIEGSDKEVVLVNLHLEAYDNGEGKIAQTNQLIDVLQTEYEKGNYVIAGGDFNQAFPGSLEQFPVADSSKWTPGVLDTDLLPEGWQLAFDTETATCRLLDSPYHESSQKYVIDGFIVSPNVQISLIETVDLDFEHADHNPVKLRVTLTETP